MTTVDQPQVREVITGMYHNNIFEAWALARGVDFEVARDDYWRLVSEDPAQCAQVIREHGSTAQAATLRQIDAAMPRRKHRARGLHRFFVDS